MVKSFKSQSAFENELNDYFMLNGEFSTEKDETYPERINYYGKINKEIEEYLGYYEPDKNIGFMLEPVIGIAAKGAWFKEAVEEKAPYDLGGWSKSKPATVRRKEALKSRDNKLTKHQQYISAARALQALANVTKDIDTKEVAKRDADYLFDEAKKFSDGDVIEHGDEHDEMAAKGKALKATAIDTKLSQNFYNSGVIFKVGDSYWAGHRKFAIESEAKSYIDSGQYTADFKNRSNIKGYEDAFIKRDFEIDNIRLEGLKEIIYNKFSNCNIEERQRDTYYDYKNGFTYHTTEFTIKNCWEYLDKNTAKIMEKNNFNPMPIEINYQINRSISKPQYIAPGGNMYVYGNKSHNRRPIYMSESSTKELQNAVDAFIKSSQERGYSTAEMIDDQLWWWKSEKYEQKHKSTSDYGIGSQAVSYVSYETSEVYRIKDLDKAFDKYIKLNYPNEEPHKVVENLIKNNFRFKKDKNIFDWDKGLLYNAGSYTETLDEDGGTVAKDGIKTKKRHIYAITLSQFDNPQYIEVDSKDIDDAVTKFKENGNVAPSMIYFSNKPPYYYKNGGGIAKENQEMVMNEAYQIQHHAHELLGVLKKNVEVPAWVVAKIHSSAENLSAATHYLAGTKGMSKYKNGGGLKQEWIAVFRNMQRPNEQRVISVLGSTKEDAMRDAEMSRHSNNITKEYQLINIYLSPSLKIVDYYETKELGVWMLETSDGVKEEYYYGDETSEEESGELVGYLYFYNKDNTRKALAKANFIGGSYDAPEWGDLEFIEAEIIAAKGKSIDDNSNSLADYERWRNSPDFSNSITILNEQDIDYSNWSDIDIYRWWVKKNENNDDNDNDDDDDDDDYAANGKYIKGLNKRIDRSIKSGRAMTLFRKMEDENYHSEAAFLVAKAVGTPQDIQDMADIVERHYDSDEGISTEDYNKRYEIQERLWPAFIAKYKKAKYSTGGGIKTDFNESNGGGVSKPLNYHAHAIEQNGKIYIGKSYYEIINKQSPYFFNVDERTRGYVDKDTNFHPLDLETGYEAYSNGGGVMGESKKSSESKEFYDFKNDLEYALMSRYNVFLSDAGITNEYVKMAMNKGQNVDEIVDDIAREYDLVAINPAEKAMD